MYTEIEAVVIGFGQFMTHFQVEVQLWADDSTPLGNVYINLNKSDVHVAGDWRALAKTALNAYLNPASYDCQNIWVGFDSEPVVKTFNNAPGRSIVTGTGATGFQVSATRDSHVNYSATMATTATIAGNASDVLVLEIAPTDSATAGDWVEIARVTNGQALTLALTLQSVQTTAGSLSGYVPAGYYAKIRAITSGTVTNSVSSGQEVLL